MSTAITPLTTRLGRLIEVLGPHRTLNGRNSRAAQPASTLAAAQRVQP